MLLMSLQPDGELYGAVILLLMLLSLAAGRGVYLIRRGSETDSSIGICICLLSAAMLVLLGLVLMLIAYEI